ncbi:hypothetical protein GCK72_005674 [Caenorhabditis remanei]|uniref:Uncharacterized protein n=1 Tax=Caenorhabditis remanei TaxID=31234 RepID=A0A6A5HFC3_CAERE|nr:hypothetical protein GCK72_005674 [Caenorhabditis remanei]KAF1765721.1 hypothetical protein GCK72_005674 [Caenorhabditis remanei]
MSSKTKEEIQTSNNQDSSEEEDENFVEKILIKDQFKLNDSFREEVDSVIKYMYVMRTLTDRFLDMCISDQSWHFDDNTNIKTSGWRYMQCFMKYVPFIEDNKSEAASLNRLHDKLGRIEEERYYDFLYVDHDSSVFRTSRDLLKDIETVYNSVEILLMRCNRRRRKLEKAAIVTDLKHHCEKYRLTVRDLDNELIRLSNLQKFVKDNGPFHGEHFQQGLLIIQQITTLRSDMIIEQMRKRELEKIRSCKSRSKSKSKGKTKSKSASRTVRVSKK